MNQQTTTSKYRDFVLLALFVAITFVLGMTPLGMIPLGLIKATCVHVPVILGSVLLGPKKGAVLGTTFGLVSLISNTMTPAVLSFAFSPFIPVPGQATGSPLALVICFVPRILVGIVPGLVFQGIQKMRKGKNTLALAAAGIVGAVLNTALVMGLMYLLFQDAYAAAKGIETTMVLVGILGVVGTNGVAETVVAAVLVTAIGKGILAATKRG
nr:ECF transporter S component [uncultured Solibaculum sp.]